MTILGSSGYVNNFEDYALEKVSYTDEQIVSLVSGALDASVTAGRNDKAFGKPTTRHVVYFHLKNGSTVQRVVTFTEDAEKALSNLLIESETYTDAFLAFPDTEIIIDAFCRIEENTVDRYLYSHFYDWKEQETFVALFKEEYEALTKEEKLYVKQLCSSSAYAWDKEASSMDKIETKAVAPYYDDMGLDGSDNFMIKVQMTGKIPSGRYLNSTYVIHPKMTKTITFALALFERENENYVTYEKSDFTYNNSNDHERILTLSTILEDIKNGSVLPSIGSADRYGTATVSIYGESTASFKLVYGKEGGDDLQNALIDTLSETLWSSTEQNLDDTVLMLFSLDVNGVKMYGSAFMLLRVSRADADALLEALRLYNYLDYTK